MNQENKNPDDTRLDAFLRASRAAPALPPYFQENVWRRIEETEAPVRSTGSLTWLDALVTRVLRPRFALATMVALMAAGALLGVRDGGQTARQAAQARYLALVAPNSLR